MATFTHVTKFLAKVYNPQLNNGEGGWEEKEVEKDITFEELNRTTKSQHQLHFMGLGLFYRNVTLGDNEVKFEVNDDQLYKCTVAFINTCLVVNENCSEQDKKALLNDGIALFRLGNWLMNEKFAPFFQTSIKSLTE